MKYYAVIDTNVLVSAMLNADSIPGQIAEEALSGDIIPLYNDEIIAEYEDVLRRQKFKFDRKSVHFLVDTIIERGIPTDAGPVEDILPDATDIIFYAVTMEKRKEEDAYLITGNLKHFPSKSFVVTPREMLEIIRNSK